MRRIQAFQTVDPRETTVTRPGSPSGSESLEITPGEGTVNGVTSIVLYRSNLASGWRLRVDPVNVRVVGPPDGFFADAVRSTRLEPTIAGA